MKTQYAVCDLNVLTTRKKYYGSSCPLITLFFLGLLILVGFPTDPPFKKIETKALIISEAEAQFPLCRTTCKMPEPFQEPETGCNEACTYDDNGDGVGDAATTCEAAGYPCKGRSEPPSEEGGVNDSNGGPAISLITRFVSLIIVPLIAGLQDVYQQTGPGQHGLRKRQDQSLAGGIVTQGPPASRVADRLLR